MTMKVLKGSVMLCAFCVALAGCGKQHKAERVVNDFIDANISLSDYEVKCSAVDSTDRVPQERIMTMRKSVPADPLFKRGVSFRSVPLSGKYMFMRAKIISDKDTLVRTFYMDTAFEGVIAFKQN